MASHLDNIINNHEGVTNLKIVFVDVEKYSRRKTKIQKEIIRVFSQILKDALTEISREFVEYAQQNNINLRDDTIILPTGDGAAIAFSFDGLHDIHLKYALAVLRRVYDHNIQTSCKQFSEAGYCNDHTHFNIRVGISQGDGLIYKDVNERHNVAGGVINMAARVMDQADRNQIVFTSESYSMYIDMIDKPNIDELFTRYSEVRLKHDVVVDIYQYVGNPDYVNTARLSVGKLGDQLNKDRELITRYRQINDAGFKKIYPNRQELFNDLLINIIPNAKAELKIMGICVSLFRESDKPKRRIIWDSSKTVDSLATIIEKGCTVKILFLKRNLSADERKYFGIGQQADLYFMRERDEEFDYDFRGGRRLKIISNDSVGHLVRVLLNLAQRLQNEDVTKRMEIMSRLQVREYIALPSLSAYIVDNDAYITPYLSRRHCSDVPAFQVGGALTDLYSAYNGHFEAIWKSRQTTDVIDERFVRFLAADPNKTLELFDTKFKEILDKEEAKVQKNPRYHGDPERYRIEEKVIKEILDDTNHLAT